MLYPPYASKVETSNVTLLWNKVPMADSYSIKIENNQNNDVINEVITDTTFTLTNVIPSSFYYVTLTSYKVSVYANSTWSYFGTRDILGVNEKSITENNEDIIINPNPFSSSFNIEFTSSTASAISIELYNILGNKIYTKNLGFLGSGTQKVNIEPDAVLSPGFYIVEVKCGASVQYLKVIKD